MEQLSLCTRTTERVLSRPRAANAEAPHPRGGAVQQKLLQWEATAREEPLLATIGEKPAQ